MFKFQKYWLIKDFKNIFQMIHTAVNYFRVAWWFPIDPGLETFHRPVHAWFLKIALVHDIGMCVCVRVSTPEGINNQWCDIDPVWFKPVL